LSACFPLGSYPHRKQHPLPKILLIGDSISGGYEKAVKSALAGKAVVAKNEGNAQWTGTGLERIDSYLGDAKWDIIHFNWGLWDIYGWRYYDQDRSPEAYAKRLDALVTRMKKTEAKLIWATTTPVCPAHESTMLKRWKKEVIITPEQQAEYSDAALSVMKKHAVEINDLYSVVKSDLEKYSIGKDDVHFNSAGNKQLADQVVIALTNAIATQGQHHHCPLVGPRLAARGEIPLGQVHLVGQVRPLRADVCGAGHQPQCPLRQSGELTGHLPVAD
jgi:acyl-CoA thioesterase-1